MDNYAWICVWHCCYYKPNLFQCTFLNFYQSQKEIKLGWATAVLCSSRAEREREREGNLKCNGLTAADAAATSIGDSWVNEGWGRWGRLRGEKRGRGTWERRHLVDNGGQKPKGDLNEGATRRKKTKVEWIRDGFARIEVSNPISKITPLFLELIWNS